MFYVLRNFTIEPLFSDLNAKFSGYGDISVFEDTADTFIWFYIISDNPNTSQKVLEIDYFYNSIEFLLKSIPESKDFYLFTLVTLSSLKWQNSNLDLEVKICEFNQKLVSLSVSHPNVKIIDFSDFISQVDEKQLINWKYYYTSLMRINPALSGKFKSWFNKKLNAISFNRKKCIVLDLDNTIWGGVLGEDGIDGIQLGNSYPGNCFSDFQRYLVEASKNGIILAICSKNNESDVRDAFQKNPDMILKLDQIVAHRINWTNKPTNIIELANEINIGLDSIVFLDDSPVEREIVKIALPDVTVPDFPEQPYMLTDFFKNVINEYFQIYRLTTEDKEKVRLYKENSLRDNLKNEFVSIDDYLQNLGIEIEINTANKFNVSRIAQMTQKTNQFNLTTKRYTENEINKFVSNNNLVLCGSVKDRFGDNGITLLCIVVFDAQKKIAVIDTFLLSCRILGRGIEIAFLRYVLNQILDKDYNRVEASYVQTQKNDQTRDFYDKNGFKVMEINESYTNYELELQQKLNIKPYYKIISGQYEG
jgi:FkbH-like protein